MENVQDITGRVARGAALLDEMLPGWVGKIDLDKLDLRSPCRCILGQTWDGSQSDLYSPYELHVMRLLGDNDDESTYGFNAWDDEFPELTAEWKRVILARRAAALSGGAR